MQNETETGDLLNVQINLAASPGINFSKGNTTNALPLNLTGNNAGGFSILLETSISYNLLRQASNDYIAGKRFDLSEGFFARHVMVKEVMISGNNKSELEMQVYFTGSFQGSVLFHGRPVYKAASKTIEIQNLRYAMQTRNILLKGAKWLFADQITAALKKASAISLASYLDNARTMMQSVLNKEWAKELRSSGEVVNIELVNVNVLPQHLLLQIKCTGNVHLQVSLPDLHFKR